MIDILRAIAISFLCAVSLVFGYTLRFVVFLFAMVAVVLTWAVIRVSRRDEGFIP